MAKMHELLAVEKDIVGRANTIIAETMRSFTDKATEFYTGRIKRYRPFTEGDKDLLPIESKELVDTVPAKLKFTFAAVAQEYDWLLQKEGTNQIAKANLEVDGVVLAADLPATFLLALENRLAKIRTMVLTAPTLPNGVKWVEDKQRGADIWTLADALTTYRTRKYSVPFVLAQATDKHPAQVTKEEKTETIGEYTEMQWDSRVTSSYKSELLERIDKLLLATRKAIRRANDVKASEGVIGEKLFQFILNGTK